MVCANAIDTHKIQLLLIGKSKNPRCFKNVKIPLTYKSHKNAWMNANLFVEWFQHTFVPEVKQFQKNRKEGKVTYLFIYQFSYLLFLHYSSKFKMCI